MNFPWFHLSQHTDCVSSPVDSAAISAARDAIQSDLEALRTRRQAQEAERQRREEEKRRAELSPPMVAEPPAAYDGALFSNPDIRDETVRYSIVSAQHSVLADLKGRDVRAFSRQILAKVKEVYGGNPVPFYTKAGLD